MRRWLLMSCCVGLSLLVPASRGVRAAEPYVKIWVEGAYRYIESNGLPNHATGSFPNAHNPNTISAQTYRYRVAAAPTRNGSVTALGLLPFGVAINGIPFDPGAVEYWNNDANSGWRYEALSPYVQLGMDDNNAHVQPNGAYHYHGLPTGLVSPQDAARHSALVGYAADGFPVYAKYGYRIATDPASGVAALASSYRLKTGTRPNGPGGAYDGRFVEDYEFVVHAGDLDACNGREGITPDYPKGTYYYVITDAFPFLPRCLVGTMDPSFLRREGAPMRGPSNMPSPPGRDQQGPPGGPSPNGPRRGPPPPMGRPPPPRPPQ